MSSGVVHCRVPCEILWGPLNTLFYGTGFSVGLRNVTCLFQFLWCYKVGLLPCVVNLLSWFFHTYCALTVWDVCNFIVIYLTRLANCFYESSTCVKHQVYFSKAEDLASVWFSAKQTILDLDEWIFWHDKRNCEHASSCASTSCHNSFFFLLLLNSNSTGFPQRVCVDVFLCIGQINADRTVHQTSELCPEHRQ